MVELITSATVQTWRMDKHTTQSGSIFRATHVLWTADSVLSWQKPPIWLPNNTAEWMADTMTTFHTELRQHNTEAFVSFYCLGMFLSKPTLLQ